MRVEQPAVVEAGRLGLAGQGERALDRVLGLEREAELHRVLAAVAATSRPTRLRAVLGSDGSSATPAMVARLGPDEVAVRVGPAVAVELPGLADLR